MEFDGAGAQLRGSARGGVTEGPSPPSQPGIDEEAMWKRNFGESNTMEFGSYPERPGEPDCAYYIRTGQCRFGMTCKFNHPPDRMLAAAAARFWGGYPERVGQPECLYYLKTGMCKFGATCKFDHPKDKAGQVQLNILGYPLRPNEKECAYYLRTGECKFGSTCKFHHPQPSNTIVAARNPPVYPSVHSPTNPSQQSYPVGMPSWTLSRSSLIPSPQWQASSSYPQMILPQSVVQVPGWTPYSGNLASSPESQQTTGTAQYYSSADLGETSVGAQGKFSSYQPGSIPTGSVFPERPGQPECQFYMKTGDCKFGAVCKFHHPRERQIPAPNCALSPLGLPLRPGEPLCVFYSRYGICKFGSNCKFDHPINTFTYGHSTSSIPEVPTVRHLFGSSFEPPVLTLPSDRNVNGSSAMPGRKPQSGSRQTALDDQDDVAESQ